MPPIESAEAMTERGRTADGQAGLVGARVLLDGHADAGAVELLAVGARANAVAVGRAFADKAGRDGAGRAVGVCARSARREVEKERTSSAERAFRRVPDAARPVPNLRGQSLRADAGRTKVERQIEEHRPETASQMPNALAMPVEQLAADVQRLDVSGWDGPDRQK